LIRALSTDVKMRQFIALLPVLLSLVSQALGVSLFSVINFQNLECKGTETDGIIGTCLSSTECSDAGGSSLGNCAAGFGTCCYVRNTDCTATISRNGTYIANDDYPTVLATATAASCVYTFQVSGIDDGGICQIRLDFQDVVLTPAANGAVAGTASTITASGGTSGVNPPVISGTLTGQHMYLEVQGTTNPTVTIAKPATLASNKWDIRTTMIECDSAWKAPKDCTQYFTGNTGNIASFNNNCGTGTFNLAGKAELTSQDMRICIRQNAGRSQIIYNAAIDFGVNLDGTADAGVGGAICAAISNDYVQITNQSGEATFCNDFLALTDAQVANAPIIQDAPFVVSHVTDSTANTASSTGFCISYTQSV